MPAGANRIDWLICGGIDVLYYNKSFRGLAPIELATRNFQRRGFFKRTLFLYHPFHSK